MRRQSGRSGRGASWGRTLAAGAGVGVAAWGLSRAVRPRPAPLPDGPMHRVVVLGGGFGGTTFLSELHRRLGSQPRLDVLMVDRNNVNLFTPLLYQVATGMVDPDHVTYPLRSRVRRLGARFQESAVQGIDLDARQVVTDDGPIAYDTLVVSLGSVANFFGMREIAERALTLKTLGDGIALRNRIVDVFEEAEVTQDPERRAELLTFDIVGAGATGVEFATSLDGLIHHILLRDYPGIQPEEVRIRVIEALDHVVPEMSPAVSRLVAKRLEHRDIQVLLNKAVTGVEDGRLRTKDGSLLAAGTIIWTAGVRTNPIAGRLPGGHARGGRVCVNEFLQLPDRPEVYCIGDNTYFPDGESPRGVPANAPAAIQMGQAAARNVEHALRGRPLEPFQYVSRGELLALGRSHAVVNTHGILFDGPPAWVLWRAYYLFELMGMENRAGVLTDWAFAYLARRRESGRLVCQPAMAEEEGVTPEAAVRMGQTNV